MPERNSAWEKGKRQLTVLAVLFWIARIPSVNGDDASSVQMSAPQIEPVDFIDNVRPQQNEAANQRAPVVPTGWGYAIFSPDSKRVATVSVSDGAESKGEVILWDVGDPKPRVRFEQSGRIVVVAFSPDGKWLALGPHTPQSGVKLIDTTTGEMGPKLPGPVARTNAIAWSSDGTQLALASTMDKTIRVWNVSEKKLLKVLEPEASSLMALGFSKSGQLFVAGVPANDRDGLALFEPMTDQTIKSLKGHKELIEAVAFSSDSVSLASVGWDATLRLWDVTKGEELVTLKGHKKGIRSVSISSDGKRLATSNDREFKLWDGEKKELITDLGIENTGAKLVAISPDGTSLVSITRDGTAHLWDLEKRTETAKLDYDPQPMVITEAADESGSSRPVAPSTSDSSEPDAIQSLSYSRDGKWIALAREDGRISIRHAADGKVARELAGFTDVAACVTFSHDSRRVAAGSFDKSIRIWNVSTGEQLAELTGHSNWVFTMAFSPDGATLASGSYDKMIKLWDVAKSNEIATLAGHTAGVRSVAFTPDGQKLISGSADRTAIVWDLANRAPIATLKGHTAAVRAVACSPDGTTIATASEDATIKLWTTVDWTERASLSGTEGVMFWCLAFSPAGRTLAAGAFDGTVKLFDPSDGKERKTLRGPTDAITAVAFAPGASEIVAGSVDKSLRRWRAETGAMSVASAKSSDPQKPAEMKPLEAVAALNAIVLNTEQPVLSLSFSKDSKQLAVGTGAYRAAGSLQLWDLTKHEKLWKSEDSKSGLPAVAFSNDDRRIATGNFADNFLRLVDATSGKQLKEIRGHRGKVTGIAYSPNGKFFATASLDRDVKLWDATTNKEVKTFSGHSDYVYSIEFSSDGKRLLSGSSDRTARMWDIESGKETFQLKGHLGAIQQAIFSTDGTMIATASADSTVRLHEAATGNFLLTLRGHRNKVESVAFSPHGKLIATGSSDRTIRLWNPSSGAELLKLAQEGTVRVVLFARDDKYLASGCDDKSVKLWDVTGFHDEEEIISTIDVR